MGNRALIVGSHVQEHGGLGVYVHWNGGYTSCWAFCKYCALKAHRSPDSDEPYGVARLAQVIGNFFGGSLSVGVVHIPEGKLVDEADYCDNGAWIVNSKWEIVGNPCMKDLPEINLVDALSVCLDIDKAQPESERLGASMIIDHFKELSASRD